MSPGFEIEREWKDFTKAFGETIRELRELLGLSQQELANQALISQGAVSRVESGDHPGLPLVTVMKLLAAFSANIPSIADALRPEVKTLLSFAAALRPLGLKSEPLDPTFTSLLSAFQSLTQAQKRTFVRLVTPLATYLAEEVKDGPAISRDDGQVPANDDGPTTC